jgi:hypothetical protein
MECFQTIDAVYGTTATGLQTFVDEIHESMKNCLDSDDWSSHAQQHKLILEINSSKLAYNISMDDVAKHIFLSFFDQPRFGPSLDDMKGVSSSHLIKLSFVSVLYLLVGNLEELLQTGGQ